MYKQTVDPVVQTVLKVNSNVDQNTSSSNQFVTVVAVGTDKTRFDEFHIELNDKKTDDKENNSTAASGFVTVLTVGTDAEVNNASTPSEIVEEVLVYRLPGERLGFGLKFEGGTKTTECVRRLFIQSCSPNSPASRVQCSWDTLVAGDEILKIDSYSVKEMTRIDCVRCLKESNVVIKLLVKHSNQPFANQQLFLNDNATMIQSDEESSFDNYSDKNSALSLPPPVPPRKMSRKMLAKYKSTNLIMPIQELDPSEVSLKSKLISRNQTHNTEANNSMINKDGACRPNTFAPTGVNDKFLRTRNGNRCRQIPDIASSWIYIRDRDSSDVNGSPPNAEVYLDLLSQELECGIRTESESDDTGSTISTVIDKQNSMFIASNASSIASDSVPSTPRAIQKHINVSNVINPFEILELEYGSENPPNNDFLFTRFVTSHDILCYEDGANNNNKKKTDFYKISLVPPANFQDAPLSYGNEDVNSILPQNYTTDKHNPSTPVQNQIDDNYQMENCNNIHQQGEDSGIPVPKPRRCSNLKNNSVEVKESLQNTPQITGLDEIDNIPLETNLPRLVNFVPKSSADVSPHKEDDSNTYIIKLNDTGKEKDEDSTTTHESSKYIENIEENKLLEIIQNEQRKEEKNNNKYEENLNEISPKKTDKQNALFFNNCQDKGKICKQTDYWDDNKQPSFNHFTGRSVSIKENIEVDTSSYEKDIIKSTSSLISHEKHLTENTMENDVVPKQDETSTDNIETVIAHENFVQSEQSQPTASEASSLSSVSSLPMHFSSRLPPDGQEFPIACDETLNKTYVPPKNETSEKERMKHYSLKMNDIKSYNSNVNNNNNNNVRSFTWNRDKHSSGSVKDKIAIFSATENSEPVFPNNNLNKNSKIYKSSENLVDNKKMLSKNSPVSKSCLFINKLSNNESNNIKTNVLNDIPDSTPSKDVEVTVQEQMNPLSKSSSHVSNVPLLHSASMTRIPNYKLPTRSQSMLDINHLGAHSTDAQNGYDSRKLTLNNLIEQRRRRLSKLRGLVIPQKEVAANEPVLDLPEIRSKEQIRADFRRSLDSSGTLESGHIRNNSISGGPLSSWKDNSITDSCPKYSPAFKRKSLQIYGTEPPKIPVPEPRSSVRTDTFKVLPSTNKPLDKPEINSSFKTDCASSPNQIKCSSQPSYDFDCTYTNSSYQDSASRGNINKQTEASNMQTSKQSSHLDFAFNQNDQNSSTDLETSTAKLPLLPLESTLQTKHTSEMYYQNNNTFKTEEQDEKDMETNSYNNLNNRILKPQSVEAINRKNILASAKCRSGKDFKTASPVIHRKFQENEAVADEKPALEKCATVALVTEEIITESSEETDIVHNDVLDSDMPIISTTLLVDIKAPTTPSDIVDLPVKEEIISSNLDTIPAISDDSDKINNTTSGVQNLENTVKKPKVNIPARFSSELTINTITSPQTTQDEKHLPGTEYKSHYRFPEKSNSVSNIKKQYEIFEAINKAALVPERKKSLVNNNAEVARVDKIEVVNNGNHLTSNESPKPRKEENNVDIEQTEDQLKENLEEVIKEINEGVEGTSQNFVNAGDVLSVQLHRETTAGSIGIILTGGIDYEAKNIVIHKILAGSCAHRDGRLQKGDRVLSINGRKMNGLTHRESIDILKDPRTTVSIVVQRSSSKETLPLPIADTNSNVATPSEDILPSIDCTDPIIVVLTKEGAGLGFSLDGGRDSPKGDKPLIIKKIFTGGAAEKSGKLQAGDELLKINDTDVANMTRIEVWSLMKKLPNGTVTLVIRR